jgi:diguanylate cyclase (GGDEF)-like protein
LKKLSRHILRQALDAVVAPALIIDAQHPERLVAYANAAAAGALGRHPGDLVGSAADTLAEGGFDPASTDLWRPRSAAGGCLEMRPMPLYDQPGRASYWLLTAAATGAPVSRPAETGPTDAHPGVTGVFMATDLWVRSLRDERTDPTTGIPGRPALEEVLQRDWVVARRQQHRLSVIAFRVDALESYHELFGRHATEACLRKVAHAIANSLQRASDYCARVGHDRFAVIIVGAEEEQAAAFAERIAQRVRHLAIHHPRSQVARYVSVTWGLSSRVPSPDAEEPTLLEDAEGRSADGESREMPARDARPG